MNTTTPPTTTPDAYGVLSDPATLTMQRLLPGPIERVWAYLVDSELRRLWLAAGEMDLRAGAPFEFVWRNDELSDPPGRRPDGHGDEHRMQSRIVEVDPPRRLVFGWSDSDDVSIDLEPHGDDVRLTLVHRRLPSRHMLLSVAAGWHAHLDVLDERLRNARPALFWDAFVQLRQEYELRIAA